MKIARRVVGRIVQLPGNEYFSPISLAAPDPSGMEGMTSAVHPGRAAAARQIIRELLIEDAIGSRRQVRAMPLQNGTWDDYYRLVVIKV